MTGSGKKQHNEILKETIQELRDKGYNAIITQNVAPDGIVVINNKIIAIEILPNNKTMIAKKQDRYSMFDDILFRTFKREPIRLDEIEKERIKLEKQAKSIVDEMLLEWNKTKVLLEEVKNDKKFEER